MRHVHQGALDRKPSSEGHHRHTAPHHLQVFNYLDQDGDGQVDIYEWSRQVSVRDTAAISARCRERGPFAEAALNGEEVVLLDNMMRRVDSLADMASQVRRRAAGGAFPGDSEDVPSSATPR